VYPVRIIGHLKSVFIFMKFSKVSKPPKSPNLFARLSKKPFSGDLFESENSL
jgi:hypothetical protein